MATPFQTFVNGELPKRPFTQDAAVAWTQGRVLVTTGVALGVTTEVFPAPPVTSVNNNTGAVVLTADSLSAIPTSQKGAASGVASLDANGFVPLSQMNPGVVERLYVVTDETARFALTTAQVQNGDVVKQELPAPAAMYYVQDDTNLGSELGYAIFAVGTAAAVAWSGVTGIPQVLLDLENISGAVTGDILQFNGLNWIKQSRDTYVAGLDLQTSDIEGLDTVLGEKQAHDLTLDALSNLPDLGFIVQIAEDSFTSRELEAGDGINITYPNGVDGNPLIALAEGPSEAQGTHGDENTYLGLNIDSHGRTTLVTAYSLQKDTVYIPNSTDTFTLATKTLYMVGDFFTTTYGNLNLQLPPLTTSTVIEIQFAFNLVQTAELNLFPDGTDLILGATPSMDLNNLLKVRPGCTLRLMYHSPTLGWATTISYSDQMGTLSVNNETSLTHTHRHKILSDATEDRTINLPDNDINLGQVITSFSFDKTTSVLTANLADTTTSTTLLNESHVTRLLDPDGAIESVPLNIGYTYRPAGATPLTAPDGIPDGTYVWLPSATLDAFESHESIPIRVFIGNHISDNGYIRLAPQTSDNLMYLDSTGATSTTDLWIDIPNYSIVTCYMVGANLWFVDVRQDVNCVGSDHFSVVDPLDRTKSVKLNVAPVSTDTQIVITIPDSDVSLGKIPAGTAPVFSSGKLMVPLADGTSIPLSTFGGTHLTGPNTPATQLAANGHYFFYVDTGSQYTGVRQLSLPESPTDLTYIRLSNLCSVSAFATGAGATIAPGGSDKINGVAATLDITQFLTEYQNAVITLTYSVANTNWTVAVAGDLIKPGTVAIYDADKTNTTTLTPVINLTTNRIITLPDADVDLGKVLSNISYAPTTGVITLTNVDASTFATTNTGAIADDMLRIQATGAATKKMGFDASSITAGQTRIVTMPDADVDLSNIRKYVDLPNGTAPAQKNVNTLFKLNGSTSIAINVLSGGKSWEFYADGDYNLVLTGVGTGVLLDDEGNGLQIPFSSYTIAMKAHTWIRVTGFGTHWLVEYLSNRTFRRSGALGFVSTTGAGAGDTKYKTTFVRSTGAAFTTDTTVIFPDTDVDLGQMIKLSDLRTTIKTPAQSANYTIVSSDVTPFGSVIVQCSHSSAITVTVPAPSVLIPAASVGDKVHIRQGSPNGTITLTGSALSGNLTFEGEFDTRTLVASSNSSWMVIGG